MADSYHFLSPYLDPDVPSDWLRGNHHGHSTLSDGHETPQQLIDAYEAAGYQYLAWSEHDLFVDPEDYPQATLCLLPAVEVSSDRGQTLMHLGARTALPARQLTAPQILQAVEAGGGLFVFDHPNWTPFPDYATDELLLSMEGLRGMEIYCGVIERLSGVALATDRWDRLLSAGRRVWGHATDDQHDEADRFIGWNRVQWPQGRSVDAVGIVEALAAGRFTASTGVRIDAVGVSNGTAYVTSNAEQVRWIVNGGVILKKDAGGDSTLSVAEILAAPLGDMNRGEIYARAECYGRGAAMGWSQPFWLEKR